jgi:hypothetical protein
MGEWIETAKIVPMGVEAGIPLMHLLMDTLHKELTGPLLELLHYLSLDIFIHPDLYPFSALLRGPNMTGPAPSSSWSAACPRLCRPHWDRYYAAQWHILWACHVTSSWYWHVSSWILTGRQPLFPRNCVTAYWSCLNGFCTWNAGIYLRHAVLICCNLPIL